MPEPPRPRALGAAFRSALAAAALTALFDLSITTAHASQPVRGFAWVRALEAALGLYGAFGAFVGVAVGVVAAAILATAPNFSLRAWREDVRRDPERDRAQAAGLLAAAAALGLLAAIVFVYAIAVGMEMAARRNGALSTAMVAAAAVPLCALAWFPLYRIFRVAVAPLPRPRVIMALGGLAAIVGFVVVAAVASVDWRVIDFGPFEAMGLFAATFAGHAWFWYGTPRGRTLREKLGARRGRLLTVGGAAVLLLSFAVTWLRFGDEPRSLALVGEESMGAKTLLRLARRFADHDHDGYAGRLGGGDCDDHNPKIHPGADEIRGNDVDEDCDGVAAPALTENAPRPDENTSKAAAAYRFKGNLVVITIDTLRADRVNAKTMPRLAAYAQKSISFRHAYAQAPNTPRSFPSFLTSRFPSQVRWVRMNMNFPPIQDAPENTTFFQALHDAGLHTVGEFSHFYLKPENGIARGFDLWNDDGALTLHDSNTDIAAPRITERVLARLKELKSSRKRFALWTHFFEPHSRYMEHEEFPARSSGLKGLEEKYDGEVSFDDRYLGQILDAIDKAGLADDTAVVIFSDHGEAFGEHRFGGERMFFHGQTLYDELLRVPLIVHVPGLKPRAVDDRVMLIDLGPTLIDLVKAQRPANFRGRSLLPALLGEPLAPRAAYAELLPAPSWNHLWRAIIDGEDKLIHKISENSIELYDLEHDPTEQKNLAASDEARTARMQKLLRTFLAGEGG